MLPLDGVTVVSLEQAVAAPFATRQLADLGARVIKVERPEGDFARRYDQTVNGLSSHFVWLNRSKESITLDLKSGFGRRVLDALLGRADVFVQNLAPGATSRLGLDAASCARRWPRLIVCDLSGYGASGPYRDKKAYDLLVQAEAGLISVTGSADEPARVGISVADICAGMYAYTGILTALYERERTGRAAPLEVSLFDSLVEWMGFPLYFTSYGGLAPTRTGAAHATIAPYGPYPTADGPVLIGLQNDREWVRFCRDVLADETLVTAPEYATNVARVRNRAALDALITDRLSGVGRADAEALLERAGIAYSRLNQVAEVADHPQLAARDRWREIATPKGPVRAVLPPVTVPGREPRMGPVPDVGEHTAAILAELGIDPEDDGVKRPDAREERQ